MKSKHQDQTKTSCKHCTFAIYEGQTQTSCKADRIESFRRHGNLIEAYDEEKEFYVISRLCNLATHDDVTLEEAKTKSALSFDLFLETSKIKTVPSFELEYYEDKFLTILVHDDSVTKQQRVKIFELYSKIKNAKIVSCLDYEFAMHEKVYYSKKSYHCIAHVEKDIPKDLLGKMNNVVNKDLEKAVTCEVDGIMFISNLAYKMCAESRESTDYTSNIKEVIAKSKERNLHREL
jgi:hypothetical protein